VEVLGCDGQSGRFAKVAGTIVLDEVDPARSAVAVDIDAASLDSHQEQRDAHPKSADFLDVENFPTITFRSTRVEPADATRARVVRDLTVRGVTRAVALEAEYAGSGKNVLGKPIVGFSAATRLSRKEFGLTWDMHAQPPRSAVATDRLRVARRAPLRAGASSV
jgi:polyisoprenoid-binding protein YceI